MDKTDQKLIAALRRDARTPVSELARALGLSRATVRARMEKLVASGEILGFTAVVKGDDRELPIRGMTSIKIERRGQDAIIAQLSGFPEVNAIHTTNGRWDVIVELGAETLGDLDEVLNRIRLIDGVVDSDTSLFLATRRSSRVRRPAAG